MGIGLANIISILNPEIVVLGGPVIERSDLYFNKAIEIAKSRIYKVNDRTLAFTKSYFEKETTSVGICAMMVAQAFNKK
jgi:predicted NBD/HSP70 family sugar kinase